MTKNLWLLPLQKIDRHDVSIAGGKGANLGEMIRYGLPVPPGFLVTTYAYYDFLEQAGLAGKIKKILMDHNANDLDQLAKASKSIQNLILKAKFPPELSRLILDHYQKLGKGVMADLKVAVRSSATAEDLKDASFAGQQATFLNVVGEKALITAIQECWASLFTPRAIYYRQIHGYLNKKVGISVIVQKMIASVSSGVMFTINPVNNKKDEIVIEAVFGLGELIVQGSVVPDHFVVDKQKLEIKVAKKGSQDKQMAWQKDKNVIKSLTFKQKQEFKISREEVVKIARLGKKLENHYFQPQDVEWSIDEEGKVYIIQTRPVTTVSMIDKKLSQKAQVIGKPDLIGSAASPGVASGLARIIKTNKQASGFKKGEILVAKMTSPDLVPIMKRSAAILTQEGGLTSHAAIVSRELGKPCIVGVENLLDKVKTGDFLTVDANHGRVYFGDKHIDLKVKSLGRSVTKDKNRQTITKIYVNLSDPDLAESIASQDVDGVGLLRAEFMIINEFKKHPKLLISQNKSKEFVEKMVANLSRFAKAFYPRPVIYRATDFKTNEYRQMKGGDRFEPEESNPMMGFRGAYRYVKDGQIFDLELESLKKVRQSGLSNLHLMIPFIRRLDEVDLIKAKINKYGLEQSQHFQLWIMVEVPSMVILIDELMAKGIQGVSIGTNDLTMLTLGVDRDNHEVADLYSELDSAVLWSVERVINAGKKRKVTVSVCGQAPSLYEEFTEKLIKWGVTSVSVSPDRINPTRELVYRLEEKL